MIAQTNGVALAVTRGESKYGPYLDFSVGDGVAHGNTLEGWRKEFEKHAVIVLGTTATRPSERYDERGRFPFAGVTSRPVTRVELRYDSGAPLVVRDVDGGFVMMADGNRGLREIVAYDRAGHELDRRDVSSFQPDR